MAIGSDYENNNGSSNGGYQSRVYDNDYYSRLKIKNANQTLSIIYGAGLMKITISTYDQAAGATNDLITIHLSPIKANLLAAEIDELLKNIEEGNIDPSKGFGVNAGMNEKITYIAFSADVDKHIYATIGKFSGNSGEIVEAYKFEFNFDYIHALEWNDIDSNDLVKVYDNLAEINMLRNAIYDFSRASNGAYGYSVADITRYDRARADRRMDQVFDRLGIERKTGGNGSYNRQQSSFLNNSSSKSTTVDDIGDLLT